jgi:chromosome segregation ATPase
MIEEYFNKVTSKMSLLTQDRDKLKEVNTEIKNQLDTALTANSRYEEKIKDLSSKNYELNIEINSRYESEDAELIKENERLLDLCQTLETEIEHLRLKRKRDKSNRRLKYSNTNYKNEFIANFVNEDEY